MFYSESFSIQNFSLNEAEKPKNEVNFRKNTISHLQKSNKKLDRHSFEYF